MAVSPPATLFNVPLALPRSDAEALLLALRRLLEAQLGRQVEALDDDLTELDRFFSPIRREASIRREIGQVSAVEIDAPFLEPPLILSGGQRRLVTPEGRVFMQVLERGLDGPDSTVLLTSADVSWAEHAALEYWRGLGLARIQRVIRLGEGKDERLRFASVALVLLLLINRSTTEERALTRPEDAKERAVLDNALAAPMKLFADRLDPQVRRKRKSEHFSLYSGYPLTEAKRRLGARLIQEGDRIYIAPGSEDEVIEYLARDLQQRKGLDQATLDGALDVLVDAYRAALPVLASARLAFERPVETDRVLGRLRDAYSTAPEP